MVAPLHPYDIVITLGNATLNGLLARDERGSPMVRKSFSPPLMPVSITQQDVTYSSIPREQGSDIAIEGFAGGAGAYYYEPGKYAFGENIATENGLVYPGPLVNLTTIVAKDTATNGENIVSSSNANPAVFTTQAAHGLAVGDVIVISGHSVGALNGVHTVTVVGSVTTFQVGAGGVGGVGGTWSLGPTAAITAYCRHYDSDQGGEVDLFAAGAHLYRWHLTENRWRRTHTLAKAPNTIAINSTSEAVQCVVTTVTPHNLATGDQVIIEGHNISARNGTWTVTVTGATTFTIPLNTMGAGTGTATGTVRPVNVAVTDLLSFHNGVNRLILWATGAHRYRLSTDNGQNWRNSSDASGDLKIKLWAVREMGESNPMVLGAVDPDVIFAVADPDGGAWDTGTRVGYRDTRTDLFTSLTTSPITGEVLVGKKLGWRTFDANGAPMMALGPVPINSGLGAPNFSHPARVGAAVYTVLNDFDIVEYNQGTITTGFGVSRAGPRVPEMQRAIVALAGDGHHYLYAALEGESGYVMRGQYQENDTWHWHGAYIKLTRSIGKMWVSSHPASSDTNQYLVVCPGSAPFATPPFRYRLPRTDLQTDENAQFAGTGFIRFGYERAGQAHVFKRIAHMTLHGLNLDQNNVWRMAYRKDDNLEFVTNAGWEFNVNGHVLYLPPTVYGKRFEIKLTYDSQNSNSRPALEGLITRYYRRPTRLRVAKFSLMAVSLMANLAGAADVTIGPQAMEVFLRERLMADIDLPLFTFMYNNQEVVFPGEILNIEEEWMKVSGGGSGEGQGHALVFTLTVQELPTNGYAPAQYYQGGAP